MNDCCRSSVPSTPKSLTKRNRVVFLLSVIVSVAGFLCLALFPAESASKPNSIMRSLAFYGLAAPTYLAIQIIAEEALRGMTQGRKWPSQLAAATILVTVYAVWFYRHN